MSMRCIVGLELLGTWFRKIHGRCVHFQVSEYADSELLEQKYSKDKPQTSNISISRDPVRNAHSLVLPDLLVQKLRVQGPVTLFQLTFHVSSDAFSSLRTADQGERLRIYTKKTNQMHTYL